MHSNALHLCCALILSASKAIIYKLNSIPKLTDVQERIASDGNDFAPNTLDSTEMLLKSETAKWAKVIKTSGAAAE